MTANRYQFKKALKSHKDLRRQMKREKGAEASVKEYLQEKFSHARYLYELVDVATPGEIGKSIEMISQDESIKACGLENLVKHAGEGVSYLEGKMDIDTAVQIAGTASQINTEMGLLNPTTITRQLTGGLVVLDRIEAIAKSSVAVIAAAAYWSRAYQRKNSFDYWLKRELVKRGVMQDELKLLARMEVNPEPPHHFSSWEEIEKNILKDENFENISYRKYRVMLENKLGELFAFRDRAEGKLKGHEKDWMKLNQAISEEDIHQILVNLQARHANRKLDTIERQIETRLLAEAKYDADSSTLHMNAKIARVLDEYVEDRNPDKKRKPFINQINEFKNNKISEKTIDKIEQAKEDNDGLKLKLSKKEEDKRRDFIAKTLVLASFVLSLALTITALAVPGAQPVLIAAGVVLLAGLVLANFIKPGVLTDLKNDFSNFVGKIGKEFWHSSQKDKIKKSVKQKNSLNELIKELSSESQQHGEYVTVELKQVLIADYRKLKNILETSSHKGHHDLFFQNRDIGEEHQIHDRLTRIQTLDDDDFNGLHEIVKEIQSHYKENELPNNKQIAGTIRNIVETANRLDSILEPLDREKNIL